MSCREGNGRPIHLGLGLVAMQDSCSVVPNSNCGLHIYGSENSNDAVLCVSLTTHCSKRDVSHYSVFKHKNVNRKKTSWDDNKETRKYNGRNMP